MVILIEYFNYSNIFFTENIVELLEYIKISYYIIELKKINNCFLTQFIV